jgi:topoisomerase-4 subunit A
VLAAVPVEGSHLAVSGTNRKLLILPIDELPQQARGKGVTLMRLKDAEIADVRTLDPAEGLSWTGNGKERRVADLTPWLGGRATAGRMAPQGFPKNHKFN